MLSSGPKLCQDLSLIALEKNFNVLSQQRQIKSMELRGHLLAPENN